jgi:hypothetical protein
MGGDLHLISAPAKSLIGLDSAKKVVAPNGIVKNHLLQRRHLCDFSREPTLLFNLLLPWTEARRRSMTTGRAIWP